MPQQDFNYPPCTKRHPATEDGTSCKPIPVLTFWSVNADMQEDEVRAQIRDFADKGIGGFFIHSRAGRTIDYLGPEWEALCRISLEEARACGLQAWLYDEDGWPSGFAGGLVMKGHPEYCIKRMRFGRDLPEGTTVLAAYRQQNTVCVRCENVEDADWVCYYYTDPHYADLMEPKAMDAFIRSTHEWYKERFGEYFGNTIPGIFTDEPQLNGSGYTWNDALIARYKEAEDRDLLDDLWMLYLGNSETEKAFHRVYMRIMNAQFHESFVVKIADWCEANHLLFTGHFASEDGLVIQPHAAGDVMFHYRVMQVPAIDHLGRRITSPVLCRQIGSIGNQFDKEYLLSETFGCSGWNTPAKEYLWIWQYQAAHGINIPCLHLSTYSMRGVRKRDYPLFFSYQNNWWEGMAPFNRAMEAISSFIPRRDVQNRVLVISPLDGVVAGQSEVRAAYLSGQYRVLLENLLDNQVDFDLGSPWVIESDGRVDGTELCIGNGRYSLVILAQTDHMTPAVEALLGQYRKNGGRLILVNEYENRLADDAHPVSFMAATIPNRRRMFAKYFRSIGFKRPVEILRADGTTAESLVVRYDRSASRVMIWNGDENDRRELYVVTQGRNRLAMWDFNTESFVELTENRYADGKTYTTLRLEPYATPLLTVTATAEPVSGSEEPYRCEALTEWKAERLDPNLLTLDIGKFRLDGDPWRSEVPVIRTHREVYERAAQNGGHCDAWYAFEFEVADNFAAWDTVTLCVEDSADEILLNGQPVPTNDSEWYVDKSIREYSVGALLKTGVNEVQIGYHIRATDGFTHTDDIFETERNRFFFEKEPESVYVRGDFDVLAPGSWETTLRYHTVQAGRFTLAPATPKTPRDLTPQNAWFYRGRVSYTTVLKAAQEKTVLRFEDIQAPYAELEVNGSVVGRLISPPFTMDLTPYLTQAENEVRVVLYSSNRNMLGPHHHVSGELDFVGTSSFKGEKGWEDFVNCEVVDEVTWLDRYSFCPLQLGKVVKESGSIGR
ncbi:MAG: hypothetical protein J6K98_05610 [Clostridia bacterium]|nr:hypothetical protein [Clostridia bacterium]